MVSCAKAQDQKSLPRGPQGVSFFLSGEEWAQHCTGSVTVLCYLGTEGSSLRGRDSASLKAIVEVSPRGDLNVDCTSLVSLSLPSPHTLVLCHACFCSAHWCFASFVGFTPAVCHDTVTAPEGFSVELSPVSPLSHQSLPPAVHSDALVIFFNRFSPKSKIPAR
jgi:hypothetical protein